MSNAQPAGQRPRDVSVIHSIQPHTIYNPSGLTKIPQPPLNCHACGKKKRLRTFLRPAQPFDFLNCPPEPHRPFWDRRCTNARVLLWATQSSMLAGGLPCVRGGRAASFRAFLIATTYCCSLAVRSWLPWTTLWTDVSRSVAISLCRSSTCKKSFLPPSLPTQVIQKLFVPGRYLPQKGKPPFLQLQFLAKRSLGACLLQVLPFHPCSFQ